MTEIIDRNDLKIYFGGAIKALPDGVIEGMGVAYTSPEIRDLHKEFFDTTTDHAENDYKFTDARILYNHGLDATMNIRNIGKPTKARRDEAGVWLQVQLNLSDEYEQMIYEMTEAGKLHWSSGALPQSVIVDENGHIKRWAIIEFSLTPTPAMPYTNRITTAKSLIQSNQHTDSPTGHIGSNGYKGDTGASADNEPAQANVHIVKTTPINKGQSKMDNEEMQKVEGNPAEVLTGIAEQLIALAQSMGMPEGEAVAMAKEVVEEEAKAEGATPEEDPEEKAEKMIKRLIKKHEANKAKVQKFANRAAALVNDYLKAQPATQQLPGYSGRGVGGKLTILDGVGENLKFSHLTALDMAMAWKIATASSPFNPLKSVRGFEGRNATDYISEDFYRAAMRKAINLAETTTLSRSQDAMHLKSIQPFKADELNASDITGQGLEYLGNVYDTMVWETARNTQIYKLMLSRGMMEKQVPQGMKTTVVPIEGNDPPVYGGIEANSVDATGKPETVYKFTPITTSTVDVTPGTFRTATAYTFELGEDSFVDMAQEANRKVRLALEEHIEKAMINGDTETAASTNINLIDGTPTSTGLTRDYYLEFNGLRKSPLVTSTAYSRNGGVLAIDDYRRTWALLGSNQAPRKENIFFLIDFNTFQASLDLLPTLTRDVAGDKAALFTGNLDDLWGVPIYTSGFMSLSNSAGKIPVAGGTLGQILAVYAPYWAFVFKRNITIEMERSANSETFDFYGSMRFALQRRSASASAISYNLTV